MPSFTRFVKSESDWKPLSGEGVPNGVLARGVIYRPPGFHMRAPDGSGRWWELRQALLLKTNGKVFAIRADAYFPEIDKQGKVRAYAGCFTSVIIYDSDSDGKFDSPVESNRMTIHVPDWAK
jgi:hypothetical protein